MSIAIMSMFFVVFAVHVAFLVTSLCASIASIGAGIEMGPNNPRQCKLVELEGYGPSTGSTMISALEVGVN